MINRIFAAVLLGSLALTTARSQTQPVSGALPAASASTETNRLPAAARQPKEALPAAAHLSKSTKLPSANETPVSGALPAAAAPKPMHLPKSPALPSANGTPPAARQPESPALPAMVEIPAGHFWMGSMGVGEDYDEAPVHRVDISRAFHMAATEVTNAQFEEFRPEHKALRGKNGLCKDDDEAVTNVSWNDAMDYCQWLSEKTGKTYRLPTEAEWEYACRAGTSFPFYMGDGLSGSLHKNQQKARTPEPVSLRVGNAPANAFGLYDMHGNVEEWCLDWYAPYSAEAQTDPVVVSGGLYRVTRGGSHNTPEKYLRSANRMAMIPDDKHSMTGFRIVEAPYPAGWSIDNSHEQNTVKSTFHWKKTSGKVPLFTEPQVYVLPPKSPLPPLPPEAQCHQQKNMPVEAQSFQRDPLPPLPPEAQCHQQKNMPSEAQSFQRDPLPPLPPEAQCHQQNNLPPGAQSFQRDPLPPLPPEAQCHQRKSLDPKPNTPFYKHNHQPAVTWCDNGDLLAIWFSADEENGRDMVVLSSRLHPGATQWEPAELFFKVPDRNMTGSSLLNDKKGTLYHFNGVEAAGDWQNLAMVMRTSKDNGHTWSRPRIIEGEHTVHHQVIQGPIILEDGTMVQLCDAGPGSEDGTSIHLSHDGGQNWYDPWDGAPLPDFTEGGTGTTIAGIHAGIVQLKDGSLMAMGRGIDNAVMGPDGKRHLPVSISRDGGKTWTYHASEFPPIQGHQRLVLMRLNEGPLMLVSFTDHPTRTPQSQQGMEFIGANGKSFRGYGAYVALSYDEGKSWPVKKLLTDGRERYLNGGAWTQFFVMDGTHAEPRGYLTGTQSPDNVIHVLSSRIHYSFNLAWIESK